MIPTEAREAILQAARQAYGSHMHLSPADQEGARDAVALAAVAAHDAWWLEAMAEPSGARLQRAWREAFGHYHGQAFCSRPDCRMPRRSDALDPNGCLGCSGWDHRIDCPQHPTHAGIYEGQPRPWAWVREDGTPCPCDACKGKSPATSAQMFGTITWGVGDDDPR